MRVVCFGLCCVALLTAAVRAEQVRSRPSGVANVLIGGDVLVARDVGRSIAAVGDSSYPFRGITSVLHGADAAVANLECALSDSCVFLPKRFQFNAPSRMAYFLARAGFTAMTLANNHACDCGRDGLLETARHLRKYGVYPLGVGQDQARAAEPVILQINGVRVAFLGFVDMPLEGMMPLADLPGPALADTARLLPAVRAARAKADRVVVLLHWGREYSPIPTEQQRQLAGAIVEAGANLVVGSHPHVLQTVERVGKGIVFYSVGNFVFDQSGEERSSSVLVNARFGPAGDCIGITPIRIDRCQPRLASGVEADRVIEMLQSRSPEVHLAKSSAGEWVVE